LFHNLLAYQKLAERYEVIVVDDASTDSTPRIAEQMGARTLRVEHRKISIHAFIVHGAGRENLLLQVRKRGEHKTDCQRRTQLSISE
jgi:glycosyltransferase involved in cell wall biosynthesis